jgi:hypothetical protein
MCYKQRHLERIGKLKATLYKAGLTNQLSFYGICRFKTQQEEKYRRLEVFSDKAFTASDVNTIKDFFDSYIPEVTDTIFVYHDHVLKELTQDGNA